MEIIFFTSNDIPCFFESYSFQISLFYFFLQKRLRQTYKVESLDVLINHSTELVEQLERQCPKVLFATYYMTLNGKGLGL